MHYTTQIALTFQLTPSHSLAHHQPKAIPALFGRLRDKAIHIPEPRDRDPGAQPALTGPKFHAWVTGIERLTDQEVDARLSVGL